MDKNENTPACAHLKVSRHTTEKEVALPGGGFILSTIGWWACDLCGRNFQPSPLAEEG